MHRTVWISAALAAACATAPLTVQAQACLYRGDSADTRVANRSGEITTPFPDGLSALDCRRLRVVTGAVTVYTLSQDRHAITPRRVEAGTGPLLPNPGNNDADAPPELLKQIMVVLEGGQRLKTGSSRGGVDNYLLAALPTGLLAQPDRDLVIPLDRQPDAQLGSLELLVDGKPALLHRGAASELRLPAKALLPGAVAVWKLVYAGRQYEGKFQVQPADRLHALVTQLEQDGAALDPTLRQLRTAAALVQAGYAWDARDWLRQALLR